jgi:glycosyltransferase involved in cell wall biosynthesis
MYVGGPHTRSVIIVTDIYPPVPAVGVYRTVALCRRLVEKGWHVTVITAKPALDVFLDHALLERAPAGVRIIRTAAPHLLTLAARILRKRPRAAAQSASQGAAPAAASHPSKSRKGLFRKTIDWLSWWIHLPDTSTGWFIPAVWAGLREARRERPDVIYCTAPAWTSHLVGAALSRLLRVPLLADFQDPWCGSAWHKVPYRTHQRIDEAMERLVVRQARQITCAWDGIRKHLAARYSHRQEEIRTILNGFPPGELEGIAPQRLDETRCVLLHTGMFYGPRSPIPMLEGLRRFKDQYPGDAKGLLVAFVGQPEYGGRPLQSLVQEHGLDGLVRVIPRVTRREALALLKGADVAMLFGQSGNEALASVPAKTYDYISAGAPVLAIGAGTEACEIMRRGGCRVWATRADNPSTIVDALKQIVVAYGQNGLNGQYVAAEKEAFAWPRLAEELATVLEQTAHGRRHQACPTPC